MSHKVIKSGPGKGAYEEHKKNRVTKGGPKKETGGPMFDNVNEVRKYKGRKKEYSNMGAITVKSGPR